MNRYEINSKYLELKDEILNIKSRFNDSNLTIHKARNELKIIEFASVTTVIKSFKIPHILNQVVYSFFRDSKAKKSYDYSIKIASFTPEPIAYIEFYKFGLLKSSYFISEKFEYDFTIREPLLEKDFKDREEVFQAFARFTLELHNHDIFHNDYSPGNILIKKTSNGFEFKIVDINRMKFYKLSLDDRAKNFSKLWADDEVLEVMAKEYMRNFEVDEEFIQKILYYSNENKRVKNFKKRIKTKMKKGQNG